MNIERSSLKQTIVVGYVSLVVVVKIRTQNEPVIGKELQILFLDLLSYFF